MSEIERAVQILRAGGLVAFPTETVYGLGADARNADAVSKIFRVKQRPSTNPLIVHVSGVAMAKLYAREWPDFARRLAQAYWPGPLTLVVPRFRTIVPEVSARLDTVGLRMPDHAAALELIRAFDGPIAAPSANRSTHVSPTTAQHVRDELGDDVDLILDGGPCTVGIESTVLDLTCTPRPKIVRPGGITQAQIEAVIGPVQSLTTVTSIDTPATSPGQHERHYAPITPAFRVDGVPSFVGEARVAIIRGSADNALHRPAPHVVEMPDDPTEYARLLYSVLREFDALTLQAIYIQMPPDTPAWTAVRDRIRRATMPAQSNLLD